MKSWPAICVGSFPIQDHILNQRWRFFSGPLFGSACTTADRCARTGKQTPSSWSSFVLVFRRFVYAFFRGCLTGGIPSTTKVLSFTHYCLSKVGRTNFSQICYSFSNTVRLFYRRSASKQSLHITSQRKKPVNFKCSFRLNSERCAGVRCSRCLALFIKNNWVYFLVRCKQGIVEKKLKELGAIHRNLLPLK